MAKNPKYNFLLGYIVDGREQTKTAHPFYNELILTSSLEDEEAYARRYIKTELRFGGDDYDWLIARTYLNKIYLTVSSSDNDFLWRGYFGLINCEINYDDNIMSISNITPDDGYNEILADYGKEFDLIKDGNVAQETVRCEVMPMAQVWIKDSANVTNLTKSNAWECPADSTALDGTNMAGWTGSSYMFFKWGQHIYGGIGLSAWDCISIVDGAYTYPDTFVWYVQEEDSNGNLTGYAHFGVYLLTGGSGNNYATSLSVSNSYPTDYWERTILQETNNLDFNLTIQMTDSTALQCTGIVHIYTRQIIGNRKSITTNVITRPSLDGDTNTNYTHYTNSFALKFRFEVNKSQTPTDWGLFNDSLYYGDPLFLTNATVPTFYTAVGTDSWRTLSMFAWINPYYDTEYDALVYQRNLKGITVYNAINYILQQLNSTLTISSNFLLTSTGGFIESMFNRLLITQITNIKKNEESVPAKTCVVTLEEIMTWLKTMYMVYWRINPISNTFQIEHISWFLNHDMSGTGIGWSIDLRSYLNNRNNKAWIYGQNTLTHDNNVASIYNWENTESSSENGFDKLQVTFKEYFTYNNNNIQDKTKNTTLSNAATNIDFYIQHLETDSSDDMVGIFKCEPFDNVSMQTEYNRVQLVSSYNVSGTGRWIKTTSNAGRVIYLFSGSSGYNLYTVKNISLCDTIEKIIDTDGNDITTATVVIYKAYSLGGSLPKDIIDIIDISDIATLTEDDMKGTTLVDLIIQIPDLITPSVTFDYLTLTCPAGSCLCSRISYLQYDGTTILYGLNYKQKWLYLFTQYLSFLLPGSLTETVNEETNAIFIHKPRKLLQIQESIEIPTNAELLIFDRLRTMFSSGYSADGGVIYNIERNLLTNMNTITLRYAAQ